MEATSPPSIEELRARALRILKYIGITVVVLLVVGVAAALWLRVWLSHSLNASLPQLDGQVAVSGLSAPVTVQRTDHGLPAITAANLHDLLFAQGYVTAQDRLWQMDMVRRHAAGTLAEVLGPDFVQADKLQRYLQVRAAAEAALPYMPADQVQALTDYAAGVNAFINTHQDSLPTEFRILRYSPAQWTPLDSVLVGFSMTQELGTSFPTKLARETLTAKLRPDLLADLYPVGSWRDHPAAESKPDITAPDQEPPDTPLDETQTRLTLPAESLEKLNSLLHPFNCDQCTSGSNDWVVAGSRTASGRPLLSNDMHLGLTVPGIWYQATLSSPELHATGVTLPGVPFIIVGHNDYIAWGFTALLADVQDLYIEKFRPSMDNKKAYEYQTRDGNWLPVPSHEEVVHVRRGHDVKMTVGLTKHGNMTTPVITPAIEHEKRPISLAWIIYDPAVASNNPFLAVNKATNYEQFSSAFRSFGGPSLSAVYADIEGHIAYHAIGKVPIRGDKSHPSGLSAVPVDDNSYDWSGYIPYDLMPQSLDPAGGVLATANSRVTADDYPFPITLDWENPYRNERIWKQLGGKTGLTAADMFKLQLDIYSDLDRVIAQRLAYAIDHSTTKDKRLHQAADILRTWTGSMDVTTPAPAIVTAARAALWPMLLKPYLGDQWQVYRWNEKAFVQETLISNTPARWLPKQYANWSELLTAAVEQGLKDGGAPSDLSKWSYGTTHGINLQHPLFGANKLFRSFFPDRTGPGAFPLPGNGVTVRAGGATFGASERFTADLANWDESNLNIPLGQSGNVRSPYFIDQWTNWYDGKPLPLPFSLNAVRTATKHTLTLHP